MPNNRSITCNKKGGHMNTTEKFHIYFESAENQIGARSTIKTYS
jgi:hypothetical protein